MTAAEATTAPSPVVIDGEEADGLPAALCMAAAEVINEKGLGSFSLREVARRAGVSHAAPGYHFGDMRGLLTAMAIQGFNALEREIRQAAASTDDPVERMVTIGRTYVRIALTYPAHCEVMWRHDLIDADDPNYSEAGKSCFGALVEVIEAFAAERNPDLAVMDAAWLCWTSVQGQVTLHAKLASIAGLDDRPTMEAADELSERLTRLMLAGIDPGGSAEPTAG